MSSVSNERIHANLLILDAKNYDKWCKKIKVLFGYPDVLKVIMDGVTALVEDATDAQ